MKRLVVVESPTKARTIRKFLSSDFQVEASMGHVRDLPSSASEIPASYKKLDWSRLGVNVDDNFSPLYVVPSDKKKVVKQLKSALKGAEELYIATDEDREGESIGWHLLEVLNPDIPVRRMVFHEITKEAIQGALDTTRDVNSNLVEAQETRRILDRLVGYSLSPLLWKKIAPKLSAGRVQSVAVRILVHREKERITFVPAEYWDLSANLDKSGTGFEATMAQLGGLRLASGRDFADETGRLKEGLTDGEDLVVVSRERAEILQKSLAESEWTVRDVDRRTTTRNPYPPFITSTLQQEASRKLRLSARDTMRTAQKLYEQGYITYMRTDSTQLSKEAIHASRSAVKERYGKNFLSDGPRTFSGKVRNAQEAHEAIRPAGTQMKTAEELGLSGRQRSLYDLIWKRTVASQMAKARINQVTAFLEAGKGDDLAEFRAYGRSIQFPGFFRAYVEGSDDPDAELENREAPLPELQAGDVVELKDLEAKGHETKPPARYTEASLIKKLESEGIGRPSTYASIIDTIVHRGYARRKGSQLIPTFTAFATNNLLEEQFSQLVDIGFTAEMEQVLDDIASGDTDAVPYLQGFYQGDAGLKHRIDEGLDKIDARAVSCISFPKWDPFVVRVGKYGPYVELPQNGDSTKASLPPDLAPGDIEHEDLKGFIEEKEKGDTVMGIHPEHDLPVLLKSGPYGPYMQLGDDEQEGKPKRVSLPKGMQPEDVDWDTALALINLPRELGNHPETGKVIKAHIGRYGPYVQHGSTFASLTKDDDVLAVELDRALELIAKKEAKNKPQRVLGEHPEDGKMVEIWEGRYGPYVKHNKTNASLPKNRAIDSITMEEAVELLAEKASRKKGGKKKKGGRKKSGGKKKTAKKKKS